MIHNFNSIKIIQRLYKVIYIFIGIQIITKTNEFLGKPKFLYSLKLLNNRLVKAMLMESGNLEKGEGRLYKKIV